MHISCRMDHLPLVPILNQTLLGCQHTANFDYKFPTAHHASLWPPVSQSTVQILPIMPQHTPRQVNTPDNSDSSEYESDSGPGSVSASSISQPSALNGRMPQHEDMEIIRHLQLENQMLKNNNRALGETNKTLSANQR